MGLLSIQNTQARKRELSSRIDGILGAGGAAAKDFECLAGRLIFAESQIFGRGAPQRMRTISHACKAQGFVTAEGCVAEALLFLRDRVVNGQPRRLVCQEKQTFHLFTDAASEEHHTVALGASYTTRGAWLLTGFLKRFLEPFSPV